MLKAIDRVLNSITMYKVVLYGLLSIWSLAFLLSAFTNELPFSALELLLSTFVIAASCAIVNGMFGWFLRIPTNSESWLITVLILSLTLLPATTPSLMLAAAGGGAMAMASKYLLAWHRKHIFNPAAFTLLVLGLAGNGLATWWVGSEVLLPLVAVVGLLIVRKIRRAALLGSFLIASLASIAFTAYMNGIFSLDILPSLFLAWPIVFLGTVMLTEPLTTPPTRNLQIAYGVIVGLVFGAQFELGPLYSTPEFALIVGNIYSYIVSPKDKLLLKLISRQQVADHIYHFVFAPDRQLAFSAGQYLEWTLPVKQPDIRGNRRYFTIASSPTEDTLQLGVRVQEKGGSAFKSALMALQPGDTMLAGQLAGDFTPPSQSQKLVLIAGGIGVTPFRSMVKAFVDKGERRDVVLFYAAANPEAFAYRDLFTLAEEKIGMRTHYVLSGNNEVPKEWKGKTGYITAEMLASEVPDYKDRAFYLSGPDAMVRGYRQMLLKAGIPHKRIVTDYFPGF